jgi:hypothetical protein
LVRIIFVVIGIAAGVVTKLFIPPASDFPAAFRTNSDFGFHGCFIAGLAFYFLLFVSKPFALVLPVKFHPENQTQICRLIRF